MQPIISAAAFEEQTVEERASASAEACYCKAFDVNPSDLAALSNLGTTLASLGKSDEAIPTLLRALWLDPKDIESLRNLGWLYHCSGWFAQSEAMYRRAIVEIEANPDSRSQDLIIVQKQYAELLHSMGRTASAAAADARVAALRSSTAQDAANEHAPGMPLALTGGCRYRRRPFI